MPRVRWENRNPSAYDLIQFLRSLMQHSVMIVYDESYYLPNVSLRIMNKVYLFHLYLQHVNKGRSSPLTGQIFVHFE
jgi:hypothetical protein